jgi:hypothetical protein
VLEFFVVDFLVGAVLVQFCLIFLSKLGFMVIYRVFLKYFLGSLHFLGFKGIIFTPYIYIIILLRSSSIRLATLTFVNIRLPHPKDSLSLFTSFTTVINPVG